MKKISYYRGDAVLFHSKVLKAKRNSAQDPHYTGRMHALWNVSVAQFGEYDQRFVANTLERMSQKNLTGQDVEDFQRLYSYRDNMMVDLRGKLSCDYAGREYPFCPQCDIGETGTLDHILPQSVFPVLSDHPRNLIRCCHKCNGYKSSTWLENGKRKYLNLYIDEMPDVQMLFVTLGVDGTDITYEYYVDNPNGADADIYRMYGNTFMKLHLKERYEFLTNEEITNVKSSINNVQKIFHASDDQLKEMIRQGAYDEQSKHGVNYWRAILKLAICDNDVVFGMMK